MTSNASVRKARLAAEREFRLSEAPQPVEADEAPPVRRGGFVADAYTRMGRPGQCGGCGAFRLDGNPPTVHRTDCVYGPDGSQLSPLYDPAAVAAIRANAVKRPLTPPPAQPGARRRR